MTTQKQRAAMGRWLASGLHSSASRLDAGAELNFALDFLLRTRAGFVDSRGPANDPRLGPPGASTLPRIWNRSINFCKFPVKRKTQNVVAFFAACLFVVVLLRANSFLSFYFAPKFVPRRVK